MSSDFDATIAETFDKPPGGVGVREASIIALQEIFGSNFDHGFIERLVPEIKRMTPSQVVKLALYSGPRQVLLAEARAFMSRSNGTLDQYVPAGKGIPLIWPDALPLPVITEAFVRVKLRELIKQIGQPLADGSSWPKPCRGFRIFWDRYCRARSAFYETWGVRLDFGIVSSGHDNFINKCFDAWGVPRPDFMVTDDDLRSRAHAHLPPALRSKPSPEPFKILYREWQEETQAGGNGSKAGRIRNALYIGDSAEADGGLARNLNLPFLWFQPRGRKPPVRDGVEFLVPSWIMLLPLFGNRAGEMMSKGRSFREIVQATLFKA
ncbi:MAG: hypothetical protein QOG91_270 [Candidatus Parcubacteria bacterium]|nr:hypothetical protein [Candidatus Parcubacteria bacterium]